ncbi:VLF-1 [Drosophila innubila nudivirus]|uniref:VLF-1 n=1 Tax=Drosophila innubila nudivirus TaxID=2057187 RepID=A0A2H4UX50_9VIRU|nr:VLF-1 [Drosophila innubila nudivirus]ATZ81490.1 VLF-1 [Drosophila innubila nudivirus]
MADSDFANQMLAIGATSTFDATKLSNSTLRSTASHIRTLKRNNIPINEQSLTLNTVYMLDRLVDTHGKLLNDQYKRQIGLTIKRMYPESEIMLEPYNNTRHRKSQTRMASEKFVTEIRMIRDATTDILSSINNRNMIDDLGQYDTCISILLTISTSLRINEILQLKFTHIPKIEANEPVAIKSKASNNVRFIAPNELLLNVFQTITRQRMLVKNNIEKKKSDHASKFQLQRFTNDYLVISSEDHMRKKLHEISASLGIKSPILGFNVFRKHVTSVLTSNGGHFVAQSLNNHSSLNTTLDHYNVVTPQAAQITFDALIGKFNSLDPPELIDENPDIVMDGENSFRLKSKNENQLQMPNKSQTLDLPSTSSSSKFNVLDGLFDKQFDNLSATYDKSNSNLDSLQVKLQNNWNLDSFNFILKIMTDDIQNEKKLVNKLNSDLKDQMLLAQQFKQNVNLNIISNYKKKLDTLIQQNTDFKRGVYRNIESLKRQYDRNIQQQNNNIQLSATSALNSQPSLNSNQQSQQQQQQEQQQQQQQQQQMIQQQSFEVYETPPYSNNDVFMKSPI